MASSNSRPDGDSVSSSSPPLLQDTPTDIQAAAREGKLLNLRIVCIVFLVKSVLYLTLKQQFCLPELTLYTRENAMALARSAGNLSALCGIAAKYT